MKNQITIAIALIVVLFGCKREIEMNFPDEYTKPVFEAIITTQVQHHTITIKQSTAYSNLKATPAATGAIVSINDSKGNSYSFEEGKDGVYISLIPFAAMPGVTYSLATQWNGEEFTASYTLDSVLISVDSLRSAKGQFYNDEGTMVDVYWGTVTAQEPNTLHNYYAASLCKKEEYPGKPERTMVYSDVMFNGYSFVDEPFIWARASPGDTLVFRFYQVSSEYNDFIKSLSAVIGEFDPFFSTLPSPAKGNISNGGLGFFLVAEVHEYGFVAD